MLKTRSPIESSVTLARRRWFLQTLINRVTVCWSAALFLGLIWVVCQPLLLDSPPDNLEWYIVLGLVGIGSCLAIFLARASTPSMRDIALEVDHRFQLKERLTTALGLTQTERGTEVGQAVLADASKKVAPLKVREKFPVRPTRFAALIPILAGGVVAAWLFPIPFDEELGAVVKKEDPKKAAAIEQPKQGGKTQKQLAQRNSEPEMAPRAGKAKELKDLESEINEMLKKYDLDPNRESQEKLKEKIKDLTTLEEKVKKFEREKADRLDRMEQQLKQLDRLDKDKEFQDGPAKGLKNALENGDLKKAEQEFDQLKKKLKDKSLSKEELEKLTNQLDHMKDKLREGFMDKDREMELEKKIANAKREGKDAESLERELKQMRDQAKANADAAKNIADKMDKAQNAMKKGDLEEAAKELGQAAQSISQTEEELKDLEEAEEQLQRLKGEKDEMAKKTKKKKKKNKGAKGEKGDDEGDDEDDDDSESGPNEGGIGRGKREINPNAQTSSEEQRIRALFDARGKKSYGGSTRGQAFKKATTAEMGNAIQEAAQAAPKATDSQRLPRDAKDSVREYFQSLGGQVEGGNK